MGECEAAFEGSRPKTVVPTEEKNKDCAEYKIYFTKLFSLVVITLNLFYTRG